MFVRRVARSGVLAAVAGVVVVVASLSVPSATVALGATPAPPVDRSPYNNILFGVLASGPNEAYAVGTGGPGRTRALIWDGTSWVGTDPPGRLPSELFDVTAIDGRVWAGGVDIELGVVLRLHGDQWKQIATPPPDPGLGRFIQAIDGTSSDDVWAAGWDTPGDGSRDPLMLHWDGAGWTEHEVPLPYDDDDGAINSMVVIAPDDAWAVGNSSGGSRDAAFIAHWDGREWTVDTDVISPFEDDMVLWGVDAAGPDDVWIVGDASDTSGILHWNGEVWSLVPAEVEVRSEIDLLYGVSVIAEDDVWAVGGHSDSYPPRNARVMHWNGVRWKEFKAPTPGESRYLTSVDGASSDDVWAVGTYQRPGEDIQRHLYLHWDGDRWSRVRPSGKTS